MDIKIKINKCNDCRHSDHTGAFTKGGAKPCCNHKKIVEEKGYSCFKRIIPYKMEYFELYGKQYAVAEKIPVWCPLKRGYSY